MTCFANKLPNADFAETNYIYSIYCAREYLDDDILLIHGDIVFENTVFDEVLDSGHSCMAVSSAVPLPEKDFKAVVRDGRIQSIGTGFFSEAVAAQLFYRLLKKDWAAWLDAIAGFCESGRRQCYAENAFNEIPGQCRIYPLDVGNCLCSEIDSAEDLVTVSARLREIENRTVYMCFSTDILHEGHISMNAG